MSTLLDQAVIDAEALREAAMKNAEHSILEKYSGEVKEAVTVLLQEQDPLLDAMAGGEPGGAPEPDAPPPDVGMGGEALEEETTVPDVPSAEGLCPCPDLSEGEEAGQGEKTAVELTNIADILDEEVEINFEALEQELILERERKTEMEVTSDLLDEVLDSETEEEDDLGIDDSFLDELLEELVVDIDPQKSGWIERPIDNIQLAVAQAETTTADDQDESAIFNRINGVVNELSEENENLTRQLNDVLEENTRAKKVVYHLKEKLEETNLSNAKLLYTNRVLSNSSLNERQKNRIVESLSNANTVEEAKVVFETLQGAVGSLPNRSRPQSLSEVVNRNSSTIISGRREPSQSSVEYDRMRKLAGIV